MTVLTKLNKLSSAPLNEGIYIQWNFVFMGVFNGLHVCAKFGENGMVVFDAGDLRKNFSRGSALKFCHETYRHGS